MSTLQSTEYKGEYWTDHPTIRLFWEVFHNLPLEKKKQFLCKCCPLCVTWQTISEKLLFGQAEFTDTFYVQPEK